MTLAPERPTAGNRTRRRFVLPLVIGGVLVLVAGGALLAVALSGGSSQASSGPRLRVVGAYIPEPASPDVVAGYLTVVNDGGTADRLTGVSSPLTADASIHKSADDTMTHVDAIDVPAHGRGVLARGGYHIMFMSPNRQLHKGDSVPLTLLFEKSPPITVTVPVLGLTDRPGDGSS